MALCVDGIGLLVSLGKANDSSSKVPEGHCVVIGHSAVGRSQSSHLMDFDNLMSIILTLKI